MTNGPPASIHAEIHAFLDGLEIDQSENVEAAYDELMDHSVTEEFADAENVAEDFYEDYRMLGRFEILHALLNGDAETFGDLVEETAEFVSWE